jgi:hypothetical protein
LPTYRIYTIGRYGHFSSAEDIECADDQEAVQKAQQAVCVCDIELWEQRRFIARLLSKRPRDIARLAKLMIASGEVEDWELTPEHGSVQND